jgi:hypothetical protein
MIAVLSVITLTLYVDNKRTKDCIATYMVADQKASSVRIQLTDDERTAFKQTLLVLVSGEDDPRKRLAAIEGYIALLNKNDTIRKENPPVPVPTECN